MATALATELNRAIQKEVPDVFEMLSGLGRELYFPTQRKVGRAFLPDPVALESQPGMADLPRLPEQLPFPRAF